MSTEIDLKITDSEWEIMRVVWAQKEVTSKEIIEVLQQKKDWKPATTKTFIGRLANKDMLDTRTEGRRYIYSPKVNEEKVVKSALHEQFNHICNRDVGNTIAYLLSNATLSLKDIEKLEGVLEEKKKDAVEEVACNCIPGQCECKSHHCSKDTCRERNLKKE
ncbi:MAG TPA: CopY/TcrY family copper transport repressor [Pseudogracilibacillus sp.]|nr:CopY/TcrY family copper transport repressor [Pseudogracilibacillus sp.]